MNLTIHPLKHIDRADSPSDLERLTVESIAKACGLGGLTKSRDGQVRNGGQIEPASRSKNSGVEAIAQTRECGKSLLGHEKDVEELPTVIGKQQRIAKHEGEFFGLTDVLLRVRDR